MAQASLPSPCIDVCIFESEHGWCLGCGRTRAECRVWKATPRREQQALLAKLGKRLRELKADNSKGRKH